MSDTNDQDDDQDGDRDGDDGRPYEITKRDDGTIVVNADPVTLTIPPSQYRDDPEIQQQLTDEWDVPPALFEH